MRVKVCRGYFYNCSETHRESEGRYKVEEGTEDPHKRGLRGSVIVQKQVVDVLLREHNLEDDGHQHEGVGHLIG